MSATVQPSARRWAVSFADLALLIACTLMLGWRPAGADAAAERISESLAEVPVEVMFVPGEAMLSARGGVLLAPARRVTANGVQVVVSVGMAARGSQRLDAWELAAARTAVIARNLGAEQVVLAAPGTDALVHVAAVQ